jgi:hypothetical protein
LSCRPHGLDVDSLGTTSNLPAVTSGRSKPIQLIAGNPTDPATPIVPNYFRTAAFKHADDLAPADVTIE